MVSSRAAALAALPADIAALAGPHLTVASQLRRPSQTSYSSQSTPLTLHGPWHEMLGAEALPRGDVSRLTGARSGLMGLVGAAAQGSQQVALVGFPEASWAAAVDLGADPANLLWIPHPNSRQNLDVRRICMLLVAGFDLVVGDFSGWNLTPQQSRRYSAMLRADQGTVLAVDGVWPHNAVHIDTAVVAGEGMDHGYGELSQIRLKVTITRRYQQPQNFLWEIGRNYHDSTRAVHRLHPAHTLWDIPRDSLVSPELEVSNSG